MLNIECKGNSKVPCQLPRFHALDYIDQVSAGEPLLNRRASSSAREKRWNVERTHKYALYSTTHMHIYDIQPSPGFEFEFGILCLNDHRRSLWMPNPDCVKRQIAQDVDCLDVYSGRAKAVSAGFRRFLRRKSKLFQAMDSPSKAFHFQSGDPKRCWFSIAPKWRHHVIHHSLQHGFGKGHLKKTSPNFLMLDGWTVWKPLHWPRLGSGANSINSPVVWGSIGRKTFIPQQLQKIGAIGYTLTPSKDVMCMHNPTNARLIVIYIYRVPKLPRLDYDILTKGVDNDITSVSGAHHDRPWIVWWPLPRYDHWKICICLILSYSIFTCINIRRTLRIPWVVALTSTLWGAASWSCYNWLLESALKGWVPWASHAQVIYSSIALPTREVNFSRSEMSGFHMWLRQICHTLSCKCVIFEQWREIFKI